MRLKVYKVTDEKYAVVDVTVKFAPKMITTCKTEPEARGVVKGIDLGMSAVRSLIGMGASFDGQVHTWGEEKD